MYVTSVIEFLGMFLMLHQACAYECPEDATVCEIDLVMYYKYAMTYYPAGRDGPMYPVIMNENGQTFVRLPDCDGLQPLSDEDFQDVVIGDGFHKLILTYNGTVPGPPIYVYRNQEVIIRLTNDVENEPTILHTHGQSQWGSPWMDGGAGTSSCPIQPGETFTYRFVAADAGTHWYHSHLATQRSMGAYGAFIVLERDTDIQNNRGDDQLPDIKEDYTIVVSDLMHDSSYDIFQIAEHSDIGYSLGYNSAYCFNSTLESDGVDCGVIPFFSAIINGKGWQYSEETQEALNINLPLERFTVRRGDFVRFRIICASLTYGFRISIDDHMLNVIASDGRDVVTKQVESVMIFSGERYDFWIEANDPANVGNYWIRAETLERYDKEMNRITPHHVEAILHYSNVPYKMPQSSRNCGTESPCDVINCPYMTDAEKSINCIPITALRSPANMPTLTSANSSDFLEYFLNLHFTGYQKLDGVGKPTINGRQFLMPTVPLQMYPEALLDAITVCNEDECDEEWCECTHYLDLPLNKVVQFIFYASLPNTGKSGGRKGQPHPVHLHGHGFQVVKIGYPIYDDNNLMTDVSPDITCLLNENCNTMEWSDSSWENGNVEGIIETGAPVKDTVMLPIGGYVVVRFTTWNPGFWLLHCHTELHSEPGMVMVIKEGSVNEMPRPPPKGMDRCGDSPAAFLNLLIDGNQTDGAGYPDITIESPTNIPWMWILVIVMATLCVCALMILCCTIYMYKNQPGFVPSLYYQRDREGRSAKTYLNPKYAGYETISALDSSEVVPENSNTFS